MEKLLLTMAESASAIGVGRSKFYELVRAGDIGPVIHVGRCARIPADALRRWVDAQVALAQRGDDGDATV